MLRRHFRPMGGPPCDNSCYSHEAWPLGSNKVLIDGKLNEYRWRSGDICHQTGSRWPANRRCNQDASSERRQPCDHGCAVLMFPPARQPQRAPNLTTRSQVSRPKLIFQLRNTASAFRDNRRGEPQVERTAQPCLGRPHRLRRPARRKIARSKTCNRNQLQSVRQRHIRIGQRNLVSHCYSSPFRWTTF